MSKMRPYGERHPLHGGHGEKCSICRPSERKTNRAIRKIGKKRARREGKKHE